ncbi:MAG: hypothetical protein QXO70_01270 [Candidatus Pacearchaeota archaeon]
MANTSCDIKKMKEVENKIRDLINLVSVYNTEEEEGEGKKIEDDAAADLKARLQEIAKMIASIC